jgi:hypothetical protein
METETVISLEQARVLLSRGALMLDAIQSMARSVLLTVSTEEARAVFIEERAVVIEPLPDPAKRPRGAMHPLLKLITMALSAARTQRQLLRQLHPDLSGESQGNAGAAAGELEKLVLDLQSMAKELGLDPEAA